MADGAALVKRAQQLVSLRSPHEQTWRDCCLFVDPLRADGFNGASLTVQQAQAQHALLADSTASDACELLASSILSGLTPSNSRWFGLDVGSESDEERQWLDLSADLLWQNIHNSNYDAEAFEGALDLTSAGWFVLFIDDERERGGLVFTHYAAGSCYLASSRADGRADILARPFQLSAEQAVREYGEDAVSEDIRKAALEKPDTMFEFWHHVYPRMPHAVGAKLAKNLPFASCHVEAKTRRLVRESGYHECPFIAPRWRRFKTASAYGVGPMFKVLPDVKTLNELVRTELAAASLSITGLWIGEDDGVLNPRTIKIKPGTVITANSVDSMKPLLTGSDFNVAFTIKADLQRAIRKGLMADQLEPQDGPAKTATEVHVRVNLIRQLLGPVYGRLQPEWLQPLVERCFGLAYRAGVFPPPPQSLGNREFRVTYDSPMARAQKLEDVSAMEHYEAGLGQAAASLATVDPEAAVDLLDNYDHDAAARKKAELLGVPADLIPNVRTIEKKRAARADKRQQQQQQAMVQQGMAKAVEKGGEAVAGRAFG